VDKLLSTALDGSCEIPFPLLEVMTPQPVRSAARIKLRLNDKNKTIVAQEIDLINITYKFKSEKCIIVPDGYTIAGRGTMNCQNGIGRVMEIRVLPLTKITDAGGRFI
jgi:hypothetical protein